MIFIIGGRGLVGSAFVRACETLGLPFTVIDRHSYASHIGAHCDLLINANGNSRKPLAKEKPLEDFDASVRSVRSSLEDFRFERYIHLSSCDVYPDCSSPEVTREDSLLQPAMQSPYGFHKYMAEQCVQHRAKDWLIIRFGGFVGPGLRKNAIFDIINGGPLWLDPQSELQFLHTDDAARIVLTLARMQVTREVINLCGRGTIALRDVLYATGNTITVQPGSPRVSYNVSIQKISQWLEVPETRQTVLNFVNSEPSPISLQIQRP
jgi:nucleoside-diphosphate-sugar epimerase